MYQFLHLVKLFISPNGYTGIDAVGHRLLYVKGKENLVKRFRQRIRSILLARRLYGGYKYPHAVVIRGQTRICPGVIR